MIITPCGVKHCRVRKYHSLGVLYRVRLHAERYTKLVVILSKIKVEIREEHSPIVVYWVEYLAFFWVCATLHDINEDENKEKI